ncbi:hypothetical protein RRG08_038792 [Elysia crispata]|uniref:Uncharacterized protein n=1 Tax=Elysia crispata TaxID=231223 RepID=A0AAE0YVT0_9GAST|nr:hypothetical protein RRG08_038792 [Elysia crispata]
MFNKNYIDSTIQSNQGRREMLQVSQAFDQGATQQRKAEGRCYRSARLLIRELHNNARQKGDVTGSYTTTPGRREMLQVSQAFDQGATQQRKAEGRCYRSARLLIRELHNNARQKGDVTGQPGF